MYKREKSSQNKIIQAGSINEKRLILHKKLNNLSPSDVRTMRVRGSRVGTIRRGAATGISEFQVLFLEGLVETDKKEKS